MQNARRISLSRSLIMVFFLLLLSTVAYRSHPLYASVSQNTKALL